jgi:hypothetical protein
MKRSLRAAPVTANYRSRSRSRFPVPRRLGCRFSSSSACRTASVLPAVRQAPAQRCGFIRAVCARTHTLSCPHVQLVTPRPSPIVSGRRLSLIIMPVPWAGIATAFLWAGSWLHGFRSISSRGLHRPSPLYPSLRMPVPVILCLVNSERAPSCSAGSCAAGCGFIRAQLRSHTLSCPNVHLATADRRHSKMWGI